MRQTVRDRLPAGQPFSDGIMRWMLRPYRGTAPRVHPTAFIDERAQAIVAAGTLITENMRVPPKSLVMGSPGKVKRLLTQAEIADIQLYADRYVGYRLEYMP